MRNRIICLQVLLGFFAFTHYSTAYAGNGGPDAYGYTWIDSHEPGLSFSWVDITSRPSAVQLMGLGDEGLSSYLSIGFPFQYYWNTEDHLRIGANGWISFEPGTSSNANCFQAMPQQLGGATNNTLAPFMTDLSFASNNSNFPNKGELWFWSNQLDSVVISFIDVPWWKDDSLGASPPDWEGENTFQVILSGQDSSITYQYLSLSDTAFLDRIGCNTDLVIGIENIQGVIGLQPYADSVVANNYAIKFIAPATNILPVADAYAVWSMNPESKGQFILRDSIFNVTAAIGNAGNQVVDTPVVVEARLMTQSLATLWLERDTLDSVPLGPPQLITFTNLPSLPNLGQYSLRIEVKQPGDLNIQNNKVTAELDCIPDTGAYFPLGFTQNTATASSLSWALGNNGAATYMEFPFGPIRIISAEVYIIGNDADTLTPLPSGFRIDLYADSLGLPGAYLGGELVPSWAARDDWNYIPISSQPQIDSGGFFVSWLQGGIGIGLGTELSGPVSRNNFEIINGLWAPYRFNWREDLMIKVNIERLLPNGRTLPLNPFQHVSLFPNPTRSTSQLRYELTSPQRVQASLTDVCGRILWESEFSGNTLGLRTLNLNLEGLSPGIYYVTLAGRAGKTSKKLIVLH